MTSYAADLIFDGERFLPKGSSVQVNEEGRIISISDNTPSDSVYLEGLLMPGMVNAHCHVELSHLKGKISTGTGLISFLEEVIQLRDSHSEAERNQAMEDAEYSMMQNGIVAVGDICNGLSTLSLKSKRRLYYHSFVECFGLNPDRATDIVNHAKSIQTAFQAYHTSSVVLHAPYSVSKALIEQINVQAQHSIQCIHNQECAAENTLFSEGVGPFKLFIEKLSGKPWLVETYAASSLQAYLPSLTAMAHLILVHNTCSSAEDIAFLKSSQKKYFLCLCPKANLYIEGVLPKVDLFIEEDCPIVLGTDSLASNNELHLTEEIRTLQQAFPNFSDEHWLKAATLSGARALGLHQQLGSLELNKKPGLIQWQNFSSREKAIIRVLHSA